MVELSTRQCRLGDRFQPSFSDRGADQAAVAHEVLMGSEWDPYVRSTARSPADPEVVRFVRAILPTLSPTPRALDLGCGGGRHLRTFASAGILATGVDSSPAATRDPQLDVLVHDLTEALPMQDESFDLALMWGVFLHLPPASHVDVLAEVHRVLKRGGTLLMDFLRPDDFRNALGEPTADGCNRSPFIAGVTDCFLTEDQVAVLTSRFERVCTRDISHDTTQGQRVSEVCMWLRRTA